MITQLEIGDVSVDIVFKDIKNVHLSVYPPTGRVRISAPSRMSLDNIRLFAISKLGWIRKHQTKLLSQDRETPREYLDRESHYLWGQRYLLDIVEQNGAARIEIEHRTLKLYVLPRATADRKAEIVDELYRAELKAAAKPLIEKWAARLQLPVPRVFVQRMKTKWGSSNPARSTIRLNLDLAKRPVICLDYVVLHEMAHFNVPNHSDKFAELLDRNFSNWRLVRQQLNEAPLSATNWDAEMLVGSARKQRGM